MRRAAVAAACSLLLVLAACSDDESTEPTTSPPTSRLTEITGPVPAPSVTVPVVTQPVPGAATLPTTAPPPTAAPTTAAPPATTAAPVPGCDGGTLFAVLGAAHDLPAGSGAEPPRCVGDWATMVVGAPGVDRALAVFFLRRGAWTVANFGSDAVCTGAQVPAELYSDLGCALWETG